MMFLKHSNVGVLFCVFVIKSYIRPAANQPLHFKIVLLYFLYYFVIKIPIISKR